jgi:hypothetical protein
MRRAGERNAAVDPQCSAHTVTSIEPTIAGFGPAPQTLEWNKNHSSELRVKKPGGI